MSENLYMAKKRTIVDILGRALLIWWGFMIMLTLLVGGDSVWNIVSILMKNKFAVVFILLCVGKLVLNEIQKVFHIPRIITTDTLLILEFGTYIIKWEDIREIDIYKNNILIHKREGLLKKLEERIEDIVDKEALIRDLKMRGCEKNIEVATKSRWIYDHL